MKWVALFAWALFVSCRSSSAESMSPRDAGSPELGGPGCPLTLPGTGDLTGAALTREGFGCYGGCGPSCKAECLERSVTISLPMATGCTQCSYKVTSCKSHELCRWHDDCYRQCDLRWAKSRAEAPPSPPSNPCYLSCDTVVVHESPFCGADWSQLTAGPAPSVRDVCWDGSIVVFTTLISSQRVQTQCRTDEELSSRPWAPQAGGWSGAERGPATLPQGYSCGDDVDCPDQNQRCDPSVGDYPGLNGWGRCVGQMPASAIDVAALKAEGTRLLGSTKGPDAGCWFGYECASGRCQSQRCRDTQ